ncbi:MAG TPA: hypothetical protein VGN12_30340 [Pirellulales bacterium]|jgi:hypothetical protein
MATETTAVLTVGRICVLLQRGPGEVVAAAESAGIKPLLVVNGRNHYRESDVGAIRDALQAD